MAADHKDLLEICGTLDEIRDQTIQSPHTGGSGASLQAQIDLEETNNAKTSLHFEDIGMVDIVNCREG